MIWNERLPFSPTLFCAWVFPWLLAVRGGVVLESWSREMGVGERERGGEWGGVREKERAREAEREGGREREREEECMR